MAERTGRIARFFSAFRTRQIGFRKQIKLILVSLSDICTSLMGVIGYNITAKLNRDPVLNDLQVQTESTYNLIDSAVNTSIRNYLCGIAEMNKNIVAASYSRVIAGEISEEANIDLEHKVQERTKQLEFLSNLAGLTGIANRRKMDDYLHHAWKLALRNRHPLLLIIREKQSGKNCCVAAVYTG